VGNCNEISWFARTATIGRNAPVGQQIGTVFD
jgi:hypothetical protein